MKRVLWQRLVLRGFGRYRDEVAVELGDGLNTLIAPNERGKSTLVAGLSAVLFGLPGARDTAQFGQGRFRNWEGPARFEGELEFAVDGTRYRVQRNFDNHRIFLFRAEGSRWVEEVSGQHNPNARRASPAYEQRLRVLLGIASRELFEATFCVVQPLPELDRLDEEVQQLLSGAGGGHFRAALSSLEEALKALTRRSGELGVTPRNAQREGELERLDAELGELRRLVEESREVVDSLQSVRGRLAELQEIRKGLADELRPKERTLDAFGRWRAAVERWRAALREQAQLERAQREAEQREDRVRDLQERLARDYPELERAGPEVGARLEELVGVEERLAERARELKLAGEAVAEREKEAASLRAALGSEFATVVDRPDLVPDHRELRRRWAELTDLEQELSALQGDERRLRGELAKLAPWGELGRSPSTSLRGLRQRAEEARRSWERFVEERERLQALEGQLHGELAAFEEAAAAELEAVAGYQATKDRLERQHGEARRALAEAEARLAAFEKEREAFEDTYADLNGLGDETVEIIDRKVDLVERERRLAAEREEVWADLSRRRRLPRRLLPALLAAAAVGCLVYFGVPRSGPIAEWIPFLAGLGGLVSGGVAWQLATRSLESPDLRHRYGQLLLSWNELRQEIAELDAQLGPWASALAVRLGEVRQRLLARRRDSRRLDDLGRQLPPPERLAQLRERLTEAERAWEAFQEATASVREAHPDVTAAYQRWQEVRRERDLLTNRTREFARGQFGVEPDQVEDVPASELEGVWAELAQVARLTGRRVERAAELAAWLKAQSSDFWGTVQAQAQAWETYNEELARVLLRRRELERRDPQGRTVRDRLQAEVDRLQQAIAPFDLETPPEELEGRVRRAAALQRQLSLVDAELVRERTRSGRLAEEVDDLTAKAEALRTPLATILSSSAGEDGESPGLLAAQRARSRWLERESLARELQADERSLSALLTGQGADSAETLRTKLLDAAGRARQALDLAMKLVDEFPGLPSPEAADDPERIDRSLHDLEQAVAGLKDRLTQAEQEVQELLRRQAYLEGKDPLNIAVAEVRLTQLEARRKQVALEAEATALAHRELRAAVEEYQASYRERLAETASRRFVALTGVAGREVVIDEGFALSVREPDGRPCSLAQLSRGAQDQLYIALRLAVGDLIAQDVRLPFVFDDPFVNFDDERLRRVRQTLETLAAERQVVVLAHRPDFAAWGHPARLAVTGHREADSGVNGRHEGPAGAASAAQAGMPAAMGEGATGPGEEA